MIFISLGDDCNSQGPIVQSMIKLIYQPRLGSKYFVNLLAKEWKLQE